MSPLSRNYAWIQYLLLRSDPRTIRLSSIKETVSDVSAPLRRSSPRLLNVANDNSCVFHSETTPFNFASMSRSFTADIQMSYCKKETLIYVNRKRKLNMKRDVILIEHTAIEVMSTLIDD